MIDNKWFCELNEQRESWCLLILQVNDHFAINGWEIGYGNPSKLVRIIGNSKSNEKKIIKELLQEIYYCRREGISLITFKANALKILRTRIVLFNIEDVCLRGLNYICVEQLLKEYFLSSTLNSSDMPELVKKMSIETSGSSQVQLLWSLFLRIGPMLPSGVI